MQYLGNWKEWGVFRNRSPRIISARNGRLMGTAKIMSSKVNNNQGARSSFPMRFDRAFLLASRKLS
jgi:hypothetical protein